MSGDIRDTQLCRNLANAVIYQAYLDLIYEGPVSAADKVTAVHDARAFFTERTGQWAESRKNWCDAAELQELELLKFAEKQHAVFARQDEKIAAHLAERLVNATKNRSTAQRTSKRVMSSVKSNKVELWRRHKEVGVSIKDIAAENGISYDYAGLLVRVGGKIAGAE